MKNKLSAPETALRVGMLICGGVLLVLRILLIIFASHTSPFEHSMSFAMLFSIICLILTGCFYKKIINKTTSFTPVIISFVVLVWIIFFTSMNAINFIIWYPNAEIYCGHCADLNKYQDVGIMYLISYIVGFVFAMICLIPCIVCWKKGIKAQTNQRENVDYNENSQQSALYSNSNKVSGHAISITSIIVSSFAIIVMCVFIAHYNKEALLFKLSGLSGLGMLHPLLILLLSIIINIPLHMIAKDRSLYKNKSHNNYLTASRVLSYFCIGLCLSFFIPF